MSKLDTLLQDGLQSELTLQYNIKALRKTLRQQLQETKMRQTEELEKRVQQNSLLSAEIEKMSDDKEELNKQKYDFLNNGSVLCDMRNVIKNIFGFPDV